MCIHSLCVSTHRLLACESSGVTMGRMHHPAGVGRWSSSHVILGTVRQARLLSGLFPLLWSVRQLSFVLAPSWTVGLKRPNVMDVDLFQGDRNWEASKTTGFTTTSALWRRLSQHWVELDRQENWKAFSDVMGELTSTAAALEDSGGFCEGQRRRCLQRCIMGIGNLWRAIAKTVCSPTPEGGTKRCSLSSDSGSGRCHHTRPAYLQELPSRC